MLGLDFNPPWCAYNCVVTLLFFSAWRALFNFNGDPGDKDLTTCPGIQSVMPEPPYCFAGMGRAKARSRYAYISRLPIMPGITSIVILLLIGLNPAFPVVVFRYHRPQSVA